MRTIAVIAAAAMLAAGCAGEPVVGDISQDKVQIVANGASAADIYSRAEEACDMYGRNAREMSYQCADVYCIQKIVLFACVPRP